MWAIAAPWRVVTDPQSRLMGGPSRERNGPPGLMRQSGVDEVRARMANEVRAAARTSAEENCGPG